MMAACCSDTIPSVDQVGAAHGGGVWKRFSSIRKDVERRSVVRDKKAIPSGPICLLAACFQAHPGLCVAKDAAVYEASLLVATFIERHFTRGIRGDYFCIRGLDVAGEVAYEQFLLHIAIL